MSDQVFWYVTRSAALVAWLAAALSMLVGLLTSSRLLGRRPTIPWLVDIHRMLAAVSVVFLAVHMLSLGLDSYVRFGPADLLVPFAATVPGLTRSSMAWGVIAAWLLVAVEVSSLIKDRIDEKVWHTIHLGSFGALALGTLHAIQTGSDIGNPLVSGIGVSVLTAIVLAAAVRSQRRKRTPPEQAAESLAGPVDSPAARPDDRNGSPTRRRPETRRPVDPGGGPGPTARPRPGGTRPAAHGQRRARPAGD